MSLSWNSTCLSRERNETNTKHLAKWHEILSLIFENFPDNIRKYHTNVNCFI